MKVIGYIRVSTDRQADEGFGLDIQREVISQWAKTNNHKLIDVLADEGISGTLGVEHRPALSEALVRVAEGRATGVVVARLDRLARTLAVQEATLAHVWKHDGKVLTVDLGEILQDDPEDPMRTAIRQFMGVFAQLERSMIAARLRAGRRIKNEQGGYAYGAPPFGYRSDAGVLVPDDREQLVVRRIQQLVGEGLSVRGIYEVLNREHFHPKRSETWHPGSLARIIRTL